MRPIIGVNGVTTYGYAGTHATPPHPYLPPGAMGSSGVCSHHRERWSRDKFSFNDWPTWGVETPASRPHVNVILTSHTVLSFLFPFSS